MLSTKQTRSSQDGTHPFQLPHAEPELEYPPVNLEAAAEPYRQQMDRQCKTRRTNLGYVDLDGGSSQRENSAQYGSGHTHRADSGVSDGYSGQPRIIEPFEFAVQAQDDYVRPPESVFSEGGQSDQHPLATQDRLPINCSPL